MNMISLGKAKPQASGVNAGAVPEEHPALRRNSWATQTFAKATSVAMQDEQKKRLEELSPNPNGRCLIPPGNSLLGRWDTLVFMALIFTGLVTPYEVSLLDTGFFSLHPLALVNRLVDLTFLTDMVLQFFIIQDIETHEGSRYIKDHGELAWLYLKGWFAIDFVSILPYDLLGEVIDSGEVSRLKTIRLVRLFRLLKLLRMSVFGNTTYSFPIHRFRI